MNACQLGCELPPPCSVALHSPHISPFLPFRTDQPMGRGCPLQSCLRSLPGHLPPAPSRTHCDFPCFDMHHFTIFNKTCWERKEQAWDPKGSWIKPNYSSNDF